MLGLALGDALGFVVESQPPRGRARVRRRLAPLRTGRGSRPCRLSLRPIQRRHAARARAPAQRPRGDRLGPGRFAARVASLVLAGGDVGAGPGTRGSAMRLALGAPWEHAGAPAPYAGNGSAMRAGPAGLLFGGDAERWRRCVREQSRVTHQDPRSAAGAMAIAGAVALARDHAANRPSAVPR